MPAAELRKHGRQNVKAGGRRETDIELPGTPGRETARRDDRVLDLPQRITRPLQKLLPCRRQPDGTRRAFQQSDAEFGFQLADPLAQMRLRDAEASRRAPEMQFLRDGDEETKLSKFGRIFHTVGDINLSKVCIRPGIVKDV